MKEIYIIIRKETGEIWSDAYIDWQKAADLCQLYNEEEDNPDAYYIRALELK